MNSKGIAFLFCLFLSCQGPWSYYPEDPERYQGIWVNAYIISGRPVKNVCFDKMHPLSQVRMPGFPFYESASVEITGSFSGKDTTISLMPDTADFAHNPNCFVGHEDLIPEAGKKYQIDISMTWDSAGTRVTSRFSAKTHIPKKFKILRAYDLEGKQYAEKDTVMYLPPPTDMKSNYFIPEYSNDDIGGAMVTMIYGNTDEIYWGENSIDKLVNQFDDSRDTARHARFGDRELLYTATNRQIAGSKKDIDSIPIIGMNFPAIGSVKLLFYATTQEYIKYRDTFLNGDDSRTEAIYNIEGGAGIFAGMMVDTFEVNFKTLPDVKTYSYYDAQENFCLQKDDETNVEYFKTRKQCVAFWDEIPDKGHMSDLISWCEMQNFPLEKPDCGTALVAYSRIAGINSPILDREVKKWCEEHKDNSECR